MLERQGIDPASVYKEAGLDSESLDNPLARLPEKESTRAWTLASERVDDPGFGLSIARVWQPGDFHALGCAFMSSTTLREALNRVVRYNAVVYELISYSLAERGDQVILSYNPVPDKLQEPPILEDTHWAIILDGCRRIYGADLDPLEVTFWHSEPQSAMDAFLTYFRCPLRFGEPVASMSFPAEVLDRQLPSANREVALALDRVLSDYLTKLQRDDIISRTKSAISEYLPSNNVTIEMVAAALHISSRTLQRKLSADGTTFRKLAEAVRQELTESYLRDGSFTLAEISFLLGFSSPAAFSRAFKRWTGLTPQAFRGAA
jgi:AraC-like DNA-binding protein